jgi:aldose 1-epimerase
VGINLTIQPSTAVAAAAATDEIKLFTIENSKGTKLIVSNCGAAVVSLYVRDKNGNFSDIVLGYDDPVDYLNDEYYMGTVVGRYANRIAGDTVLINGQTYKLSVREGGYHHHGGTVGFNKKIFYALPFHHDNKYGIVFKYTSPHLEEGFPGEFQLEVIYTLDEEDAWTIEYKGVSDKNTLVNLTQHAYFNLSGNLSGNIDGHEIKIFGRYYLPVNAMQVPTGELAEVNNTPFDFTQFKKIAQDIVQENEQLKLGNGYDHSFVLEMKSSRDLKHAAVVNEPVSGRKMEVYTTEPAVHFYTGNFLNNVKGKNGAVYNRRSGFCLETQHYPDAPNKPSFPSTLLKAGEKFYSKTIYSFSINGS